MRRNERHSELAYSWPALVFGAAIPAAVFCKPAAWALLVATVPACLVRDWWVGR